ncbi:MAG: RluA family pseudouridine synthase [Kiloniellaceae bacterium]
MSEVQILTVGDEEAELRLDRWFKRRFPDLGHGRLEKLLRTGQVRVDGKRAKSGTRLAAGQVVRVPPLAGETPAVRRARREPAALSAAEVAALRKAVLFRDDWAIAIDKPAGLAVQGGTGQTRHLDAMLDALAFDSPERPRLVHRLDKDTSGVLLLARTGRAARALAAAFRDKVTRKIYWAPVAGVPKKRRGRIDLPLTKLSGPAGERVGADQDAGRPAVTLYQVAEDRAVGTKGQRISWLVLMPLTGRTHQLRAHCAALGTPILGDWKYGRMKAFPEGPALPEGRDLPRRLLLHAREITLPHPADGTTLRVSAPLPPHMAAAWAALGFEPAKGERAADDLVAYAEGLRHSAPPERPAEKQKRRGKPSAARAGP